MRHVLTNKNTLIIAGTAPVQVTLIMYKRRMKMADNKQLEDAIKLLNENDYIAIPITKGQMCLCDACKEPDTYCRYGAFGYTCSNLICLNQFIKEQIDYKSLISDIKTE